MQVSLSLVVVPWKQMRIKHRVHGQFMSAHVSSLGLYSLRYTVGDDKLRALLGIISGSIIGTVNHRTGFRANLGL